VRGVIGELAEQAPDDITLVDMEASIEHLTRGTVRDVDALLVVAEPYYRSLETAGRLVPLAHELGLERVWVVANKVRGPRDEEAIRHYCDGHDLELIGVVPFDDAIVEADTQGRSLIDHAPDAPAVAAVAALAETLTDRLGVRVPVPR
jgi:CO dehydrogenase maturation factor